MSSVEQPSASAGTAASPASPSAAGSSPSLPAAVAASSSAPAVSSWASPSTPASSAPAASAVEQSTAGAVSAVAGASWMKQADTGNTEFTPPIRTCSSVSDVLASITWSVKTVVTVFSSSAMSLVAADRYPESRTKWKRSSGWVPIPSSTWSSWLSYDSTTMVYVPASSSTGNGPAVMSTPLFNRCTWSKVISAAHSSWAPAGTPTAMAVRNTGSAAAATNIRAERFSGSRMKSSRDMTLSLGTTRQ